MPLHHAPCCIARGLLSQTYCTRTSQRMLECLFAVKPKVCSFLDVTRQTLGDSNNDMDRLVAGYVDTHALTDLKLVYTDRRGYHLTLPASQRDVVEKNDLFIRIASQAKKTVACSTEQLVQLNNRCKEMISQILLSTEECLGKLQDAIRARLHLIFAVGESVRDRRPYTSPRPVLSPRSRARLTPLR